MGSLRKTVNLLLTILGLIIAFAGVLLWQDQQAQILSVLAGFLLIEAGVWGLANPFLPSHRQFTRLREEVDAFIGQVRVLNSAQLAAREDDTPENRKRVADLVAEMHISVDRMAALAGTPDAREEALGPRS